MQRSSLRCCAKGQNLRKALLPRGAHRPTARTRRWRSTFFHSAAPRAVKSAASSFKSRNSCFNRGHQKKSQITLFFAPRSAQVKTLRCNRYQTGTTIASTVGTRPLEKGAHEVIGMMYAGPCSSEKGLKAFAHGIFRNWGSSDKLVREHR